MQRQKVDVMGNESDLRLRVLRSLGATPAAIDELLVYNHNRFNHGRRWKLPLADEPHVAVWENYRNEAERKGVFPVLQEHLVQLRFPVAAGISQSEAYRAAVYRGAPVEAHDFSLNRPDGLQLVIHQTPVGKIPLLYSDDRQDFIRLVQALARRNEPVPLPDSIGAYIVAGYNNWGRIRDYRRSREKTHPALSWDEEFRRLILRKELYQDTFIILNNNEYSGVPAEAVGMESCEWRQRSLVIRREHECTHYLMRRLFGAMRNNILDELIADYVGIVKAFGSFRADLFLRVMGLEHFPQSRLGGRIENYRGEPPLSDEAFALLKRLVIMAAYNLERFVRKRSALSLRDDGLLRITVALARLTMEELASEAGVMVLEEALRDSKGEVVCESNGSEAE